MPELWTKAIALVDPAMTTPRVCDFTEPASQAGVEIGLTPTQALARCREVTIRHRSPSQEAAATAALLQAAYGFSPHIENTGPGLVTLDLRGLGELAPHESGLHTASDRAIDEGRYPTLRSWAQRLRTSIESLNLTARIGIGATPNIARHAARWGQADEAASIHIVTHTPDFIAGLPVAALDPSTHVGEILRQWGVRSVGEFMALGQDAVMDRLGLEAIALFAAASGSTMRPLHLVRPAEDYEESFDFEHEVETLEPLLFVLNRFVTQLGRRLEIGGLAAGMLRLNLRLESGEVIERRLRVPQPTRRADILLRMLETHLETVRTESPIVSVTLQADPTPVEQRQFSLFEAALRDPHQFQETLARLSALVGFDRVGTPVRENSHRPDTFRLISPDFENAPLVLKPRVSELLRQTPTRRLRPSVPAMVEPGPPTSSPPPAQRKGNTTRPTTPAVTSRRIVDLLGPLFRTSGPAPAGNETGPAKAPLENLAVGGERENLRPNGTASSVADTHPAPLTLRCSVAQGTIAIALGPWRASGQWWEPGAWERDEWDVQIQDGPALRLVQSRGDWRVEAMVD